MIDLKSIRALTTEFEAVAKNMWRFHSDQDMYLDYYQNNVFYAPKQGQKYQQSPLSVNLLKVFADKNVDYISPFPDMKTVTSSPLEFERIKAGTREKVVLATHRANNMPLQHRKGAFDGTVLARAVFITTWDHKKRCVKIRRADPRFVYVQYANDNDTKVVAVWEAFPMTKDQIQSEYGVTPTGGSVDTTILTRNTASRLDGKDWFLAITRYDDEHVVSWVGDQFLTRPHKHKLGTLPVDIIDPLYDGDWSRQPDFFIKTLVSPQAEYNETMRRISNIARKLGNPAVWGRGIMARQFEDVKRALRGDGGFVGLKGDGELGILQVPETKMLDAYLDRLMDAMQRLSSFGNASFGESVGANTSGDALSMYFQPTTRRIDYQNIAWKHAYESINTKILKYYDTFLRKNERVKLQGYQPMGSVMGISGNAGTTHKDGFAVEFTKDDIDGNYDTVVTPRTATPKDEIAYKRLIMEMVSNGVISRTTAYEEFGLQNPEDELAKLENEQGSPELNPEGELQRAQAEQALTGDIPNAPTGSRQPEKV